MADGVRGNSQLKNISTNLQHFTNVGGSKKIDIKKLDIGKLLATHNNSTAQNDNIVSSERCTYDNAQGVLIRYKDGTMMFQTQKEVNGKKVICQYKFDNEKKMEKNRPSSQVINPGQKNQVTYNYEYYHNGKVKNTEIRNAQNVLIREEEFNRKGLIKSRTLYDKNGELSQNIKFEHDTKNHTSVAKAYDKDNKLISTAYNQYQADGKTLVSQKINDANGNLQKISNYDEKGKPTDETVYYANSNIKATTEYWDNGVIKERRTYDENGKVVNKISAEIDGNFENSRQVSEGDCYLMATINSIRELDNGQQMLKDLVKVETNENGEKIYTVTFPGAQVAAEGLRTDDRVDPDKMYITGTYTFTETEMQDILKLAGKNYSLGDGDVILLEAAFERYRTEVAQTLDANLELKTERGFAGTQTGRNRENILAGGFSEDPIFIMTGKQSSVYSTYSDNPPYGLSYEDLQKGEAVVMSTNQCSLRALSKSAVSEIDGELTKDQEDLNRMLDSVMKDGEDGQIDNIAVASFVMVRPDGKKGGHALTLKSVTADTVILINPWHPDKEITMSREDFLKSASHVTIADTTKPSVTVEDVQQNPNSANPHLNKPQNQEGQSQLQQVAQQIQNLINKNNQGQNIHSVRRGDNLWKIARRHLGEGATATQIANYISKIMEANQSLKWDKTHTKVMIYVGDNITLP